MNVNKVVKIIDSTFVTRGAFMTWNITPECHIFIFIYILLDRVKGGVLVNESSKQTSVVIPLIFKKMM